MRWSTQALTVLGGAKLYSGRPSRTVSACLISSISSALSANDASCAGVRCSAGTIRASPVAASRCGIG
ncbi:MAG: hypothetical protein JWR48_3029, partial [Mycobacterium sp.]|nr:hypothetical protein [Mycobacterium sp.]